MESSACRRSASDADQSSRWSYSATVKCEPAMVKEEPEWGEYGASEEAVAEDLCHDIKYELEIGPELIEQQDIAFSIQKGHGGIEKDPYELEVKPEVADAELVYTSTCEGEPGCPRGTQLPHGLKNCYVSLERLPVGNLSSHYYVCQPEPKPAGGVSAARDGCSSRRGDSPRSTSTGRPCGLKRYLVKLKRLPVRDQHSSAPYSVSRGCKPDQLMTDSNEEQVKSKMEILEHNKLTKLTLTHTVEYGYQCEPCDEWFKEISDYRTHVQIHTPFRCNFCNKKLKTKINLTEHLRIHTGEKPYGCEMCNKYYSTKQGLNLHLVTHTGEKPYCCKTCNKCYSSKPGLNMHLQTHTGEKRYCCEMCNKCFSYKQGLNQHMRSHNFETPYGCDMCNKLYRSKQGLKQHLRTHTGEKPYGCEMCNKCYSSRLGLKLHLLTHTGEKPYRCGMCSKCFSYKQGLDQHLRTHR